MNLVYRVETTGIGKPDICHGYLWWPVIGQVNDYVPILQQELLISL